MELSRQSRGVRRAAEKVQDVLAGKDACQEPSHARCTLRILRKGEHSPIKVGGGIVLPTDRQTQDYLLCEECEDVLNKGGERWILDKLATWERLFPLYDALTKYPPLFDEDGMVVYLAADNPAIDVVKLTHFALGLFWKASVHSWKGDMTDPRIELGPYSSYWTVLDSRCECPIARNFMIAFGCGGWI
jgi:hypothetical protein